MPEHFNSQSHPEAGKCHGSGNVTSKQNDCRDAGPHETALIDLAFVACLGGRKRHVSTIALCCGPLMAHGPFWIYFSCPADIELGNQRSTAHRPGLVPPQLAAADRTMLALFRGPARRNMS